MYCYVLDSWGWSRDVRTCMHAVYMPTATQTTKTKQSKSVGVDRKIEATQIQKKKIRRRYNNNSSIYAIPNGMESISLLSVYFYFVLVVVGLVAVVVVVGFSVFSSIWTIFPLSLSLVYFPFDCQCISISNNGSQAFISLWRIWDMSGWATENSAFFDLEWLWYFLLLLMVRC